MSDLDTLRSSSFKTAYLTRTAIRDTKKRAPVPQQAREGGYSLLGHALQARCGWVRHPWRRRGPNKE